MKLLLSPVLAHQRLEKIQSDHIARTSPFQLAQQWQHQLPSWKKHKINSGFSALLHSSCYTLTHTHTLTAYVIYTYIHEMMAYMFVPVCGLDTGSSVWRQSYTATDVLQQQMYSLETTCPTVCVCVFFIYSYLKYKDKSLFFFYIHVLCIGNTIDPRMIVPLSPSETAKRSIKLALTHINTPHINTGAHTHTPNSCINSFPR